MPPPRCARQKTRSGSELSEQTWLLRKLIFFGEIIDSHVLHTYMLVAPDFFNVGQRDSTGSTAPEVVLRALRIKKAIAGDFCALIGGRHTRTLLR
jgi:sulfhydrogenase subunit alpha